MSESNSNVPVRHGRVRAVVLGCVVVALTIGAGAQLGLIGGGKSLAKIPDDTIAGQSGGCRLLQSESGYPDNYITRVPKYKVHPPLPAHGWHGTNRTLPFNVLFHSLFHGYVVITFRSDLPKTDRAALRDWVEAHAGDRVVATPTTESGAARLDLAEWGWELRCENTSPTRAALDQFAERRTT